MNRKRQKIEELLAIINKVRKRDREFRTHFYKSLNEEKPVGIIEILVSLQYLLDRLEDLYYAAAVVNEYVTNERVMEKVLLIESYKIQGLPHADYKKAQVIEKIVNRLCERSLDGNITIDDIVMETGINGIYYEETKKLLEWMKSFDMVDEVEKNIFRSTSGMILLQPDIFKLMEEMSKKEIESAEYDLERARNSLDEEDFKWADVQSYYSMFHAAKALVLKKGYREKSHFCLIIALRELYVNENKLNGEMVENLELCMSLRHEADYGLTYHQESAETAIKYAEDFLNNALKIL